MTKRLTKADLLAGTKRRENITLDGYEGEINVRPLSDGEIAEVRAIALDGLSDSAIKALPALSKRVKSGAEIGEIGLTASDLAQAQKNDTRANYYAAAKAMSVDGEKWTEDEIATLPTGIPEKIAKAVFAISGATEKGEAEARKFCDDK